MWMWSFHIITNRSDIHSISRYVSNVLWCDMNFHNVSLIQMVSLEREKLLRFGNDSINPFNCRLGEVADENEWFEDCSLSALTMIDSLNDPRTIIFSKSDNDSQYDQTVQSICHRTHEINMIYVHHECLNTSNWRLLMMIWVTASGLK
jgi:hypothetical protein